MDENLKNNDVSSDIDVIFQPDEEYESSANGELNHIEQEPDNRKTKNKKGKANKDDDYANKTVLDGTKYLTKANVFSFAAGGFGQNLIIGVVNSYILFFLTEIAQIGLAATSTLMLAARLFDAFNDPIMGTIADRTNTKYGKLRPYLAIAPMPLLFLTIALYLPPLWLPSSGRIAYYCTIYFLWTIFYTIGDIPFWGMPSAMTPNPKERSNFITFSRIFHSIGGALPTVLLPIFSIFFGEKQPMSYFTMAIFAGVIGASLFQLVFFGSKERVKSNIPTPSVKQMAKELFSNKPLLVTVCANIAAFARAIPISAGLYLSNYLLIGVPEGLGQSMVNTLMVAGFGVSGFLGMLTTPFFTKRFEYRKLYMLSCIVGAASMALLTLLAFTVGPYMVIFVVGFFIMGLPFGLVSNLNYSMIAESMDYAEWMSGRRTEGISASLQTFMNKMMTTFQNFMIPLILIVFKYTEPSDVNPTPEQSPLTKLGLTIIATVLPLIAWVINFFVIMLYPLHGEYRANMYKELAEKREAAGLIIQPDQEAQA
ncbi:MAG TPA: glycoside-pentoside-hexuronide (GPH):cation symporter [Clostridia bacterium]|jgi:sugar (glycoside-pentoside-hexuronide) transporter|nr:glycoside-pentoside-hexuronide (GPH):cation symporter [Clostridia bacterium]